METIPKRRVLPLLIAVLAAALVLTAVVAQGTQGVQKTPSASFTARPAARQPVELLSPSYDDGGPWEVGTEQAGDNLEAHANAESYGLYWRLGACGWNQRYRYSDAWSWEQDFKRTALGGTEPYYLDTVDLQFYVGHGGPGYFTFVSNVDDHYLTTNDCYRSWGNGDNEWVALTSCQVLADSQLAPWARCMYGTHLILGFKTNAAAFSNWWQTTGYWFAYYLCHDYRVAQAWYKAADRAQPSGRIVRAIINELAYLNDRPGSSYVGGPDSYDWDAWVQTHVAGSEPPRPVNLDAVQQTMPIFRSPPLSLEEAQGQYSNLGAAFGVTTTLRTSRGSSEVTEIWTDVTGDRELEMDSTAGLYGYTDLNNLWTYTQTQRALRAPANSIMSPANARDIADQFLMSNGLMPSDAQFYEVVSDTVSGGDIVSGTVEAMNNSLLQDETPVVYQVLYSRILTYTVPANGDAPAETVDFSVIGPGAKLKVYVDPAGVVPRSPLQEPIVGALGGWRATAQQRGLVQPAAVETVDILSAEQIYSLHDNLADLVVLNEPPIDADATNIVTHTLAYWEHGAGTPQAELIPAYALQVSYLLSGTEVALDYAYLPANPTYMRPFARIDTYPTSPVDVGEVITLEAADASTPLDQLGYDAILNFPLGSGFPDDYIYEWFVGSVAPENSIGTGRSITYTVEANVEARPEGAVQKIILMVTDITNPDNNSTTTSVTVDLDLFPRLWLPFAIRPST